jgi:hypothetical protein
MIKEEMKYFFPVEFTPKDLKYHLCQKMSKTIFKNYVLHQFKRRVTKLDVLEAVPVMKEQATVDQLQYFQKHRGCCPNIAGAGFYLPKNNGTWRAYYITPYQRSKKKLVATWAYSTPKQGRHVDWAKPLAEMYPLFFSNMSEVCSVMSMILLSLNSKCLINISPVAANVQALYNIEARESLYNFQAKEQVANKPNDKVNPDHENPNHDFSTILLDLLSSMVPYRVGNHKDVTQNNCSSELIECKACIRWPEKSVLVGANLMPALGRVPVPATI